MQINGREYISVKEAAQRSGYSTTYLTILLRKGDLPAVKFGVAWAVDAEGVAQYQAGNSKQRKPRKEAVNG